MQHIHLAFAVLVALKVCSSGSSAALPKYHVLLVTSDVEAQPLVLQLSQLLSADHRVTTVLYGGVPPPPPPSITLRHVPSDAKDPAGQLSWHERWQQHVLLTPDSVVSSHVAGCAAIRSSGALAKLKPDLIVSTLYLDDGCLLPLLPKTVPIVGILPSPVGVPWVLSQLGGHFPVARMAVHGYPLQNGGFYDRLWNLWRWWQVQRHVQRQYLTPSATVVPGVPDLPTVYEERVAAVYISGDARIEKDVPSDHRLKFLGCIECASFGELPESEMAALGRPGVMVLRLHHPYVTLPDTFTKALATGLASSSLMTIDVSNVTSAGAPRIIHSGAPAADALAHPRARLFVSECSEASVLLAVHFSVPVICIPLTAGHKHATNRAVAMGLGVELDRRTLTAETLRAAIVSVTNSGGLRRAVRTRADALRHDVVSPSAAFAHDIRHLLLFGSQRRQRRPIGIIEYYCLDVVGTFAVSGAALFFIMLLMFGYVYRGMTTRKKTTKGE